MGDGFFMSAFPQLEFTSHQAMLNYKPSVFC
ncbi:hypothetical protein KPNJ1_02936 [Klebsiella pneumoniae 30660/NJST258_1]|uniref:Uncharacterized protein n=1 Tax=Klebsiella pneumoniae 30684/NJST258_2 TaxID=1420013 RepID=W8VGZ1_KLEPN|nr:hypothetical protein KPNJ2_02936 [Klebsiella pneumoniae 30684/NJST258_2]AHM85342.1 hypothetical protein KPNJ1_02936 [Klebsiella pneumoniae 30660/NJST258_1]